METLWPELLSTAYLLTGNQPSAERLTVRVLSTRAGHDREAAVAALVRRYRRSRAGEAVIEGTAVDRWWLSPADVAAAERLSRALGELTRDERAAVVLHAHEGWSPQRICELLPDVDLPGVTARLRGEVPDPATLPARLEGLVALCDPTWLEDPRGAVREAVARRRRRVLVAVGGVAAVAAVAIWVPVAQPPTRSQATATTPAPAQLEGIYAAPPRGNFTDDTALVTDLQDLLDDDGDKPAGDYRLVYGNDADGTRVVLLARPAGNRAELVWFTGAAGADPADLDISYTDDSLPLADSATAVTFPDPAGGSIRTVIVTAPGTDISVSPWVDVDPVTGMTARTYQDVAAPDGVAALTFPRPGPFGMQYLISNPGLQATGQLAPAVAGSTELFPFADDVDPGASRSGIPASAFGYAQAVRTITAATGYAADNLTITVLGAGVAPTPNGELVEVVSIAAVLPGGAVLATTGSGYEVSTEGTTTTSWGECGSSSFPAGTDPQLLTVAATCQISGPAQDSFQRVTVITAPPGDQVTLNSATHDSPTPTTLNNGWGYNTADLGRDFAVATVGATDYPVAGPTNDALAR